MDRTVLGGPHGRRMAAALASAVVATAAAAPAQAATTVLSFNNAKCTPEPTCRSSLTVDQSYGDGVGVDVSYRVFNPLDGTTYRQGLTYWETGYGDLNGVVYSGASNPYRIEITFKALAGYALSLSSFDLATYQRITASTPVNIETLSGGSLFSGQQGTNPGGHNHVTVDTAYVTDGIRLMFGPDSFNVGIDNVAFDVRRVATAAVPEPATWAMMILGFFGTGALARRRRAIPA
jgi:hypothetical protein